MPGKCILILLDGLGDRAQPELGGKTPLDAAATPNLDRLASGGSTGLFHASMVGEALPSENAHFAIFGYPAAEFPGRGPLEALGAQIPIRPGDVAILANLGCIENRGGFYHLVTDKPRLPKEFARALAEAVGSYESEGLAFSYHLTGGNRGILVVRGGASPHVTDTNPMLSGLPIPAYSATESCPPAELPAARRTAEALTRYFHQVHEILTGHEANAGNPAPVNAVLTQRAGRAGPAEPFERRLGMRGALIASGLIYQGLGRYLSMTVKGDADTGDPGADLERRIETALDLLADHDFIHVHTKTPDEAAHAKEPLGKKQVIESLDAGLGRVLPRLLQEPELLVAVAADHSTPSSGPLIHSGEAVPLILHGRGSRVDRVLRYSETAVAGGCLGLLRGRELMLMILNLLDRAKLAGIRDSARERPYFPGDVTPMAAKLPEEAP